MADPLNLTLQAASFRGVPFHVDGAGIEAGRRVQVHEYPQRDKPYAEDLGRATRGFTVDAFVIGPDYIAQAQALIAAAEQPGPGTLVHPWLGRLQVSLKELMRVRFDAQAGHAVVSFSFIEPGELAFPLAADSTPVQSQIAADTLCTAASQSFADRFSVASFPAFVSALAGTDFAASLSFASTLGGKVSALSGWAAGLTGIVHGGLGSLLGGVSIGGLLATPLALAQNVMDLFDLSSLVASLSTGSAANGPAYAAATVQASTDPLAAMAASIVALAGNGGAGGALNAPVPLLTTSPARQQAVANTAALHALVRCALLAQAVGISSHVDATVQADALAVRSALCAALDAESLVSDDASYDALQAARRAVWTDMTTRASGGARLITLTPTEVLPALVLAYDQYEDAGRADELVARNHIVHPGFVPMRALQVLSQ